MQTTQPRTVLGRAFESFEETAIAVLLGLMTVITFANVVARYVFSDNILWALEVTGFLNAWMILFGVSYAMKKGAHLGVDVLANALPPGPRKALTMVAVFGTLVFAILLFVGSWNYWAPFAGLPPLYGSWFPQAFFEVEDTPMPNALQFFSGWLNEGEPYDKLPRFIPYAILPIGMALLCFRVLQAGYWVWTDQRTLIIASHEVEEALYDVEAARAAAPSKER